MIIVRKITSICGLLFLPASLLAASQVTLKNGDRISGQIVKKDGDKLVVKADLLGEVTVPWAAVTTVVSDEPVTVVLPGGKSVTGKIATTDGKLEIITSTGTETAVIPDVSEVRNAAEEAKYRKLLHPGLRELWTGYTDFGLALARGNARTTTFTTAFMATRASRTDTIKVHFNQIYATATVDGTAATTAQALRGGWGYDRNLSSKLFLNLFNDYEKDKFQSLDLRFVFGGGAGFHAVKTDRTVLDLMGGVDYNRERFSTPLTRNSAEAYMGDDWTYKLSSASFLTQSFRFFPNLTNTGDYRINFDVGAVTALKKWLSFQLTGSDRYLSTPVGGRKRNDVLLTTGFRVSFAR